MKIKQFRHPASHAKGVTLVEILMVVGVLVILMSFAMPSVSNATIKAEMSAAVENVQYSLHLARKVARSAETGVVMHISPILQEAPQTISFTSPDLKRARNVVQIQDFTLPETIVLVSDQEAFLFDQRGLVKNPGSISLVYRDDETVTSAIDVQ